VTITRGFFASGDADRRVESGDDTLSRVDQPVQRVCPRCARISFESGPRCPYCGSSFRRGGLLGFAALLAVFAVVVLGGTALLLVAAGNEFDRRINDQVDRVHEEFQGDFDDIQRQVREELDRRLPAATPTP
jgi:hypothetical protein